MPNPIVMEHAAKNKLYMKNSLGVGVTRSESKVCHLNISLKYARNRNIEIVKRSPTTSPI